ncbi:MAG: S41 family peptidase [Gemmatirosa sp.]
MPAARSSTLRSLACALVAVWAVLPGPACAQAPGAAALSAAARAQVVDSLGAMLARHYVDADTARLIAERLRTRLRAGAYDTATAPARFAEMVTTDLRAVNGDLHLSLRHAGGSIGGPRMGGGDPMQAQARSQNFGMGRAEILPGNVGYLEITTFLHGGPGSEEALSDALRFLSRTDALIIDVRRNPGGSGALSHLVFSHFLGETPVRTIRVVERGTGRDEIQQSVARVPGPRRTEVPLYVLTSQGTGSAAEEFSFVLKNQKRATIVGDRTAGAGHMVRSLPVGHGFVGSVSITRVSDPASGLEWERVGVQPDVRVPAERALDAAHAAALRTIAQRAADAAQRTVLARLIETVEARLRDARPAVESLARWTGVYDGGRRVELVDGRLWFRARPGAMPEPLVPLGDDRFALGTMRLAFRMDGATSRLTIERPDGTRLDYPRTASLAAAP